MLYYTGLEEIVFSKHELLPEEPDELIIISGYLGPGPVKRLSELKKDENHINWWYVFIRN